MKKIILLSLLFVTIAVPARMARDVNPQRGLRMTLRFMTIFYVVYWLALLLVINRLN
jgi:hypothetical protein